MAFSIPLLGLVARAAQAPDPAPQVQVTGIVHLDARMDVVAAFQGFEFVPVGENKITVRQKSAAGLGRGSFGEPAGDTAPVPK